MLPNISLKRMKLWINNWMSHGFLVFCFCRALSSHDSLNLFNHVTPLKQVQPWFQKRFLCWIAFISRVLITKLGLLWRQYDSSIVDEIFSLLWMRCRCSLVWMRSSLLWMRSSLVVRASDRQCRSRKSPGFNPSILRHSGIWGVADEAMLNTVQSIVGRHSGIWGAADEAILNTVQSIVDMYTTIHAAHTRKNETCIF